ncbi:transposase [Streptomyces sp. NPDC002896]|uniref:transposase n=1 Tax=Streptomyces sp. NPDC002896 TaxID=3154438 RepID=UPI00332302C7
MARDFPHQVSAPPKKPAKNAGPGERKHYDRTRRRQSRRRIMVEHAIAEPKQWRSLQRWIGRRETLHEVMAAIGGLVSDRPPRRVILRRPSTALVLAGPAAC